MGNNSSFFVHNFTCTNCNVTLQEKPEYYYMFELKGYGKHHNRVFCWDCLLERAHVNVPRKPLKKKGE